MSDGWWPGKYATAESAEIARLEDALAAERAHADRLYSMLLEAAELIDVDEMPDGLFSLLDAHDVARAGTR